MYKEAPRLRPVSHEEETLQRLDGGTILSPPPLPPRHPLLPSRDMFPELMGSKIFALGELPPRTMSSVSSEEHDSPSATPLEPSAPGRESPQEGKYGGGGGGGGGGGSGGSAGWMVVDSGGEGWSPVAGAAAAAAVTSTAGAAPAVPCLARGEPVIVSSEQKLPPLLPAKSGARVRSVARTAVVVFGVALVAGLCYNYAGQAGAPPAAPVPSPPGGTGAAGQVVRAAAPPGRGVLENTHSTDVIENKHSTDVTLSRSHVYTSMTLNILMVSHAPIFVRALVLNDPD